MKEEILISQKVETIQNGVSPIIDKHGRAFTYLRLAVNEHCNLRCIYCMPNEGIDFLPDEKLLTYSEICRILEIISELGVSKIRLTGGEPLLRKDLPEIIKFANSLKKINSICVTTNGLLLSKQLSSLIDAGLTKLNISIDTLNAEKFKKITRRDGLEIVLKGLDDAIKSGISIKINVVAMRHFNDDEIPDFIEMTKQNNLTVRFIELMPFDAHQIWKTGKFYGAEQIVEDLKKYGKKLIPVDGSKTEHYVFKIESYFGKIAVIPSYSRSLCGACNRIRITADGKLLNCLYSQTETNLKNALQKNATNLEIEKIIRASFLQKYKDGWEAQKHGKEHRESMSQIGG